jgi:SPP1 gp7 family putative phage head morphogenesis protein
MAEAETFWAEKEILDAAEFYALADEMKARAFTITGVAKADLLQDVFNDLGKAVSEGTSFEEWREGLDDIWERRGWTGRAAWRVDNIFRTNIQTAYSVGRFEQMEKVSEGRPYWQYSAVNDSRTRPSHSAQHGKVYRHDEPYWSVWYPPNGYMCRCTVKTLSARQVEKRRLKVETGTPDQLPDKGFQVNPAQTPWQPDTSKYSPELKQSVEKHLETK